nr:hypothetical protein [Tanacetum cinerariifolium]
MMILEKSSLHEKIHEVDHHEKLVFLMIHQNHEKYLKNVLVLVLMEYLLMEHPGHWKLTQENRIKPQLSEQQLLELEKQTLWDIQLKSDMSWGWRKILQLRDIVKPFLWVRIGNGMNTSMWQDYVQWRDVNGNLSAFSVKLVWEALRPRGTEVLWSKTIWFAHCLPRHAFHLWLVMRISLKTQDKLCPWDVEPFTDLSTLRCVFCQAHMDSHEHIFFECSYASRVWSLVQVYTKMKYVRPLLNEITLWFQTVASKRTVQVIVGKLIFAAASYYIWRERNNRLFKGTRRSLKELRDLIIVMVRL